MNKEELIQRLTPLVRTTFGNENLVLNDAMNASNTDGWTSLNFMRLLEQGAVGQENAQSGHPSHLAPAVRLQGAC